MRIDNVKRIISCAIFVILLVFAMARCADVLESKEARKKYKPFYESETNFDVVFLGTSHMWNHVLPMELWSKYGISSYNWGYSNCTPAENYYLIQDIVKYTSPKVVVIDVYGLTEYENYNNGKYRTDRIEQQHVQFDSLPIFSLNKYRASRDVFDDYADNEDFVWDFIMYHNRWSKLGQSDFEYDITTEKGSYFLTGLGKAGFSPISEDERTGIDSVCYPYYLNLIEYCQEQGIEVLCAYLPFAANENQQKIANSIGDIVEEYPNCSYVNMLTKGILDFNTDVYSDNSHLNYSGASKVTSWIGRYLADNYSLDDYGSNIYWKDDYEEYYDYKVDVLNNQTTLTAFLVQLYDDDFVAELEIYDQRLMNSETLQALFDNAGVTLIYKESDTDKCARLVAHSAYNGTLVADVEFVCDDEDNFDIMGINKVKK